MERKIVKVGNSLGVIIPSAFLEELGVGYKDPIELEYSKELNVITIRNNKTTLSDNYFERAVKSVVEKYLNERGI